MAQFRVARPPLRRGVKVFLIVNIALYLVELVIAYIVDFDPDRIADIIHPFALSSADVTSGYVWQLFTHMWLHDPDSFTHILFNMLVLYWFGPTLEGSWGTRRFVRNYILFGLGGGLAILLTGLSYHLLTGHEQVPTLGASGAIAGLVATYCIYHWRSTLGIFSLRFTGRTLLIVFIVIDLVRLLLGEPIAVQGHWGGMLTAAAFYHKRNLNPSLLRLRFKRWRLKRRLRLKRGGKSNGDSRYLH